jgi:hypothetical protein
MLCVSFCKVFYVEDHDAECLMPALSIMTFSINDSLYGDA